MAPKNVGINEWLFWSGWKQLWSAPIKCALISDAIDNNNIDDQGEVSDDDNNNSSNNSNNNIIGDDNNSTLKHPFYKERKKLQKLQQKQK